VARSVPAVDRAADVLELLLHEQRSMPAAEIARALALPRSSVHDLLATLVRRRMLTVTDRGEFTLGVLLFELGNGYAARLDLAVEGQRVAAQIARECDETVHLAILDGTDVLYIAKIDTSHKVRMVSVVGGRLPAHCTAVGKALLASLDDDDLAGRYGSGELPTMTPKSLASLPELIAELSRIRRDGVAWDNCESNLFVRCVAAQVCDHQGEVVAAMSISVPTMRWRRDLQPKFERLARKGAAELSMRLGYRQPRRHAVGDGV
jgi:IclR family transcriptional regulator, KDG regulon repressor